MNDVIDEVQKRLGEEYEVKRVEVMKNNDTKLKGIQVRKKDMNVVRARAKAPLCTAADVTIDYILDERARELYGEEHRAVTLSRLSTKENPVLVTRSRLLRAKR